MNTAPSSLLIRAILFAAAIILASGCSDSSSDSSSNATPVNEIDSSYLDELADEQAPEPEPVVEEQTNDEPVEIVQSASDDEKREWVRERGSQSTFGKTRDRSRDLANRINGGTSNDGGLADVYEDEEYANVSGYRWDMPDGWRMAVPLSGRFAEMMISSPLGNASVAFSKETGSVNDITRDLSSILVTDSGGRNRPKTTNKTVLGLPITILDMNGTYIDPMSKGGRNESPFYAMHAAIIELQDARVVINMWGPEDTVAQNIGKFDAMIERMIKE